MCKFIAEIYQIYIFYYLFYAINRKTQERSLRWFAGVFSWHVVCLVLILMIII